MFPFPRLRLPLRSQPQLLRGALLAAAGLAALALALVWAPATRAVPAQQRCAVPSATVAGQVFDESGAAQAGAQVMIQQGPTAAGDFVTVASARSDEAGAYLAERFCPGSYRVAAQSQTIAGVLTGVYDADGDGEADTLTLTEDAPAADGIDLSLAPVAQDPAPGQPACSITDGSIAGVVTGPDGGPPSADPATTVLVEASSSTAATPGHSASVETAADGSFLLEDLCEGEYYVKASLLSADGSVLAFGYYVSDPNARASAVVIGEDDRNKEGIDIRLMHRGVQPRPTAVPTARPPLCDWSEGEVAGAVLQANGNAAIGATLFLSGASTGSGRGPVYTTHADRVGAYGFEDICAGDYIVTAQLLDAAGTIRGRGYYDADGDGQPDVIAIGMDRPSLEGIDIVLGASVSPTPVPQPSGCQLVGSISGVALDPSGDPMAGVRVLAEPQDAAALTAAGPRMALTNEEGRFTLDRVCEGDYAVTGLKTEGASVWVGWPDADGDGVPDQVGPTAFEPHVEGVQLDMRDVAAPQPPLLRGSIAIPAPLIPAR